MLEMKTVLREVLSSATVLPAGRRMERPCWRSVIVTPHAGSRVVLGPRSQAAAHIDRGLSSSGPGAEAQHADTTQAEVAVTLAAASNSRRIRN